MRLLRSEVKSVRNVVRVQGYKQRKIQRVQKKFFGNINWEIILHKQSKEHCYDRFCEFYKEGASTLVRLAVNREKSIDGVLKCKRL